MPRADDLADPVGKRRSRPAEWFLAVAELKMCVGIDESGEQHDVAQVDSVGRRRGSHCNDPFAVDGHDTAWNRRSINGNNPTGAKREV
jgi:hypothetical protein